MNKMTLALAAVLLALPNATAQCADCAADYDDNEISLIDKVKMQYALKPNMANEYQLVGKTVTGTLGEMGRRLVTLEVPRGLTGDLILFGNCDDNCNDIDLTVFNSKGDFIGTDEADDDLPAIWLKSLKAGDKLTAEVFMYDCMDENDACTFNLSLFKRK